jgi:hypothetical protein
MAHWGVDSFYPLNQRAIPGEHHPRERRVYHSNDPDADLLGPGDGRFSIFDFICQHYRRVPEFWGRYLNMDLDSTSRLTEREVAYLRWKCETLGVSCKILPVFNRILLGPEEGRLYLDSAFEGERTARDAEGAAYFMGIPRGVRIYADLEGWPATVEWLRGWCLEMFRRRYYRGMGGIYGRVPAAEFFDQNRPDFGQGRYAPQRHNYWSQELPYAMGYARDPQPLEEWPALWVTQPPGPRRVLHVFRGNEVPGAGRDLPHVETLIWQYANDIELPPPPPPRQRPGQPPPRPRRRHLVDLNLAKPAALAEMWDLTA